MGKTTGRYEFEEYFEYLDQLRESGVTNMFGASPYLVNDFGVDRSTAQRILIEWMRSFDERHPQEEKP